jgi:hypothetical protein
MALWLVLAACGGKVELDSGAGETGAEDTDTQDTGGDPAVIPVVTGVTGVNCQEYESSGEVWSIDFTADDPQGPATIASGTLTVLNEQGGEMATYDTVCNGEGVCLASIHAEYDGITCSLQGSVTFRFVVVDEDGNVSAPYDYPT